MGDFFHPPRLTQANQVVMAMGVDKARRQIKVFRVNNLGAVRRNVLADFRDPAALHQDIGDKPGRAGTVDNARFAEKKVI